MAAMGFTLGPPRDSTWQSSARRTRGTWSSNIETLDDALAIDGAFVDALHERFAGLDDDWRQLT